LARNKRWDGDHVYSDQQPGDRLTPHENSDHEDTGQAGDPVHLATGDFPYTEQDIHVAARGVPLELTRTYDTQDEYVGPFGRGWRHNYDTSLLFTSDNELDYAILCRSDGVRIEFVDNGDGSFTPPAGRHGTLWFDGGAFQLVEKHGTTYTFDVTGWLVAITGRNGNGTSLTYDALGRLIQVAESSGRTLGFGYGTNNRISTVTDPADRVFRYAYDASDNLVTVTDPLGQTAIYTYDVEERLVSITDAKETTWLVNTYDDQNRVVTQFSLGGFYSISYEGTSTEPVAVVTDRKGSQTRYEMNEQGLVTREIRDWGGLNLVTQKAYDSDLNLVSLTDPRGNTTLYEYDDNGNRNKITDAYDDETVYTYELTYNQVTSITDALDRLTTFDYDDSGNLIKITENATLTPVETTFTYDTNGDLLSTTDALGNTTTYEYDDYGYIHKIIQTLDAETIETVFVHDVLGNLLSRTNANGHTTSYEYDDANQLINTTNALDKITTYAYDANGNRETITDPLDHITTFVYDDYDKLIAVVDPLGNTTQNTYDANENLETVSDAEGNITTRMYDAVDRLVALTDALDHTTQYDYDDNGNLTSLIDGRGNETTFEYDELNRLIQMTYPDDSYEEYDYDDVGNRISKRLPSGDIIYYAYDDFNRLVTKTYPPPDSSTADFVYDDLHRLTSASDSDSAVTFAYDDLSRVEETNQNGKVVSYEYDDVGNKTKIVYPDGDWVARTYDELERLDQVKDSGDNVIADYAYDDAGRRLQVDLGNGTQATYDYDNAGRLLELVNKVVSPESIISSFAYTYDNVGNRLTTEAGDGAGVYTHVYTYDDTYQLTHVDYPDDYPGGYPFPDTTFNYDEVGNRTSVTNGGRTEYVTNDLNQYTEVGGVAYDYDDNGNLASYGTYSYDYDYENRLVSVSATTPSLTITYQYEAIGRRIQLADGTSGWSKQCVSDGYQIIAEYDEHGSLEGKYVFGGGIDEPVVLIPGTGRYYYHFDGLGSVANLTDSTAATADTYVYAAYGKLGTTPSVGNRYAFTGRELDVSEVLYCYRTRHYSAQLGRFVQRDRAGLLFDLNLYRYCWNNPVNFVDPLGLDKSRRSSAPATPGDPYALRPPSTKLSPSLEELYDDLEWQKEFTRWQEFWEFIDGRNRAKVPEGVQPIEDDWWRNLPNLTPP